MLKFIHHEVAEVIFVKGLCTFFESLVEKLLFISFWQKKNANTIKSTKSWFRKLKCFFRLLLAWRSRYQTEALSLLLSSKVGDLTRKKSSRTYVMYNVEKRDIHSHRFRDINFSKVTSLIKTLLSRNFCQKSVKKISVQSVWHLVLSILVKKNFFSKGLTFSAMLQLKNLKTLNKVLDILRFH